MGLLQAMVPVVAGKNLIPNLVLLYVKVVDSEIFASQTVPYEFRCFKDYLL
jgi:hypothetical protein